MRKANHTLLQKEGFLLDAEKYPERRVSLPTTLRGLLAINPRVLISGMSLTAQCATVCSRLAEGPSEAVRSDILVTGSTPQLITQTWAVSAADVQWTDALYPLAQEAMRRGY